MSTDLTPTEQRIVNRLGQLGAGVESSAFGDHLVTLDNGDNLAIIRDADDDTPDALAEAASVLVVSTPRQEFRYSIRMGHDVPEHVVNATIDAILGGTEDGRGKAALDADG